MDGFTMHRCVSSHTLTHTHPPLSNPTTTALQPSRRLIQRLRRRDLFASVGAVPLTPALKRRTLSSASSATAPSQQSASVGHATQQAGGHDGQELVGRVSHTPVRDWSSGLLTRYVSVDWTFLILAAD